MVALAAAIDDDALRQLAPDVDGAAIIAVTTGGQAPGGRPAPPAPHGVLQPRSLRMRLAASSALCEACGMALTPDTLGELAAVRREGEPGKEGSESVRPC